MKHRWLKMRRMLFSMKKLEKDKYVFGCLQQAFGAERPCPGVRHLRWEGTTLCNKAFMTLFGLGKGRFRTLHGAVARGEELPPLDQRFVPRGAQPLSDKAERVHQFLQKIYLELAEFLPDGINSNKRPRQRPFLHDRPEMRRSELKHLPPGSVSEYHQQCQAQNPGVSISKKLFSSEPWRC